MIIRFVILSTEGGPLSCYMIIRFVILSTECGQLSCNMIIRFAILSTEGIPLSCNMIIRSRQILGRILGTSKMHLSPHLRWPRFCCC